MTGKTNREDSCLIGCIGGCAAGTYVGYELLKEFVTKGLPAIGKEMVSPVPVFIGKLEDGGKSLMALTKAVCIPVMEVTSVAVAEASRYGLAGIHESYKTAEVLKDVVVIAGKATGSHVLTQAMESFTYATSGKRKITELICTGGNGILRSIGPSSPLLRLTTACGKELFYYPKPLFKKSVRLTTVIPCDEISELIRPLIVETAKEPLIYFSASAKKGKKDIGKTLDRTAAALSLIVQNGLIPSLEETGNYIESGVKESVKGIAFTSRVSSGVMKEIYRIVLKDVFLEFELHAAVIAYKIKGPARILFVTAYEVGRFVIESGVIFSAEFLLYASSSLRQIQGSMIYCLGMCAHIKEIRNVSKCFKEVFTYAKPPLRKIENSLVFARDSLRFPAVVGCEITFEMAGEMLVYLSAASDEFLKAFMVIGRGLRAGAAISGEPTVMVSQEALSYLTSCVREMQKSMHCAANHPNQEVLLDPLKQMFIEFYMYLSEIPKEVRKGEIFITETGRQCVDVVAPTIDNAGTIVCEGFSYVPASFNEMAKTGSYLKEDFPSSFENFVVDPTTVWWHYKHIALSEKVARLRARIQSIQDRMRNSI